MKTLIVIPARYSSSRFPGKPLAKINGIPMLDRVVAQAKEAIPLISSGTTEYVVATDDDRICAHCKARSIPYIITSPDLPSGTDRAHAAMQIHSSDADIIVNLQGDAPFTPPNHIATVAKAAAEPGYDVATPFIQLSWEALDELRNHKIQTQFSGTTLTCTQSGKALWFSKNIIPAIRNESSIRRSSILSPVRRHVGLYGFKRKSLEKYIGLDETEYERYEGLEQLRLIENGMDILCVEVFPSKISAPGIDTPEDLKRAEELIRKHGDPSNWLDNQ